MPAGPKKHRRFEHMLPDVCVIYPSKHEPDKWVAHSLMTDQVAVGVSVLDAYVAFLKVMHVLVNEAAKDPSINLLHPAPVDICKKVIGARALPKEIVEIAGMRLSRRRTFKKPPVFRRTTPLATQLELAYA